MNAYKKGKGLHLEAEPTRIKLYWVPSSRDMALDKKPPSITTKVTYRYQPELGALMVLAEAAPPTLRNACWALTFITLPPAGR